MKSVVITGVSTGIGYAAAERLLGRGWHVFGSVRKPADAERVQASLGDGFTPLGDGFTPLLFDVTDHGGVVSAEAQVRSIVGEQGLTALVNNAGISTVGPLASMPIDDLRWQFEVNLFGQLDVIQQFLPLLGGSRHATTQEPGRIVNISSVSGKIAYPFMGAYAASKHALEAMSDSLRRELLIYGIDVILIEPGTTQTPIIGKTGEQVAQYADTDYGSILERMAEMVTRREKSALPVAVVVDAIVDALESQKPKTRYALPRKRLTGWLLPRWMPDRMLDRFAARELGIEKRKK